MEILLSLRLEILKRAGLESRILVKLEYFNPAGSAKDRIALSMIEDAEERGVLKAWCSDHRAYIR